MSRGFAAIGLANPKCGANVGGVMRAVGCYGASLVVLGGERFRHWPTDVLKGWRHTPLLEVPNVFDALPYDCVPVAVDLIPGAKSIVTYTHPERAFYIFGPEDGTLGKAITDKCRDVIYVPTISCMNLSAAVNVVLYDRAAKRERITARYERPVIPHPKESTP